MRRANLPLLAAIAVEAMGYGGIFGLIADLQDTYGFPRWGLGLIAASAFPAALVGQLGLARFADRGYTRQLLWVGLATAAVGMVWFWLGNALWEFVVARILVGLGSGTFIPAARRVIISRDPDNPGEAISWAGAADIGGFLVGIPVAKGLETLLGDPNAPFLVLAIILAIVGPIATVIPEPPVVTSERTGAIRKVFSLPLARAGLCIGLGFAAIIGTFDAIAARFLKDLNSSDGALVVVMVALFVPLVLFMPVAGRLVDRVGPVRAGVAALTGAAPFLVLFGLTRHVAVIAAVGAVVALIYSIVYTAGQSAVARGTIPYGLTGAGQGAYEATYATGGMVAALLAPLIYRPEDALPMWLGVAALTLLAAFASRTAAQTTPARSDHRSAAVADADLAPEVAPERAAGSDADALGEQLAMVGGVTEEQL